MISSIFMSEHINWFLNLPKKYINWQVLVKHVSQVFIKTVLSPLMEFSVQQDIFVFEIKPKHILMQRKQ